jgi:hypothetical protein
MGATSNLEYLCDLQKSDGVFDVFKHVLGVSFDMSAPHTALLVDSLFDAVLKSLYLVYHNLQVGVGFD